MNVPSISMAGVEYPLDRPHCIMIASTTSTRVYELRVYPHARGIDTTCSCPARVACVHRKTFAEIVAVQLDGAVIVSGASIRWTNPANIEAAFAQVFA